MNDRELLTLAAKAAGIEIAYDQFGIGPYICGLLPAMEPTYWNPLTDDGDALRLAVKLELEINRGDDEGACVIVGYYHSADINYLYEQEGDAPYAATRRAIVRAAAELGKEMK